MTDKAVSPAGPGSDAGSWSIEAGASLQAVLDSSDSPLLLKRMLTAVLAWQERNRRQVGRALVSPTIAPQWSAALLALGATVTVMADGESHRVPLEYLIQRRVVGQVASLHVSAAGKRWGEAHVGRTPADEPIVAVIAALEMKGDRVGCARVALTGVWDTPVQLAAAPARLDGCLLEKEAIQAVADAVEAEVSPRGDYRGSQEYRRAMAGVLTRRALEQCLQEVDHG